MAQSELSAIIIIMSRMILISRLAAHIKSIVTWAPEDRLENATKHLLTILSHAGPDVYQDLNVLVLLVDQCQVTILNQFLH